MFRPRPWVLACALACTFDASGQGEPPDAATSAASGGGTSTGEPASTGAAVTVTTGESGGSGTGGETTGEAALTEASGSSGTTAAASTTTDTTAAGSTTTDETTGPPQPETTGPPSCDGMFVKQIRLVAEAVVTPPMVAGQSNFNEGLVAYSVYAEQGAVTFTFDVPCAGSFAVWGRVLDAEPGVNYYDPDSFYVQSDGGAEAGWFYGCQTLGLQPAYNWLRVRTGQEGAPCDQQAPLTLDLAAGTHTITLRNREQVDGQDHVAAVARLLIVNNPSYAPTLPD